jgi:uridine phosphorylase
MQYPPSELALNEENGVYHLGIRPENIATTILLVGEQNRVSMISSFFDSLEHESVNREFTCHTGNYKGKRITVLSTGIGTDNIDIVMNEIDALFNIDLNERREKKEKKSLDIIRIGTCGILQAEIPLHTYLLSSHALGLDNLAHFYAISYNKEELLLCNKIKDYVQFPKTIVPYLVEADNELTMKLLSKKTHAGITVTSSGFYGPQGRQLRVPNSIQHLSDKLSSFVNNKNQLVNFEMESSAIFALGKAMGHRCASICLGISNRPKNLFSKDYRLEMYGLIEYVLNRI